MLLNDGTYEGRRVVSAAVIHEMESPQVVIPSDLENGAGEIINSFPPALSPAYGLTLRTEDFRGERIDWHAGSIDGMGSVVGLIPSRHLGVVILANKDDTNLPIALMDVIFNDYIGPPQVDWGAHLLALMGKVRADEEESKRNIGYRANRILEPSLPLADYAGTYSDPLYGQATVSLSNGHLVLTRGSEFVGDLEPWNHDTFRVTWRYRFLGHDFVQFGLSPAEARTSLFPAGGGLSAAMTTGPPPCGGSLPGAQVLSCASRRSNSRSIRRRASSLSCPARDSSLIRPRSAASSSNSISSCSSVSLRSTSLRRSRCSS